MEQDRRMEMRDSIERALELETQQRSLDAHARVVWLAAQLEEYIDRWLGFCALPSLTMPALLQSDLFAAVEIGSAVVSENITRSHMRADAQSTWGIFLAALDEVRGARDKQQAKRLKEALIPFRAALASVV